MSGRHELYGVWQDCPVIQDAAWVGCFGFLLGPTAADILLVQGWLCCAAVPFVGLLILLAPGPGRLARRLCARIPARSLFSMLHADSRADDGRPTRFGPGKLLVGQPKEAATGIYGFIGCGEDELRVRMARGVAAVEEEVEAMGDEVLYTTAAFAAINQPMRNLKTRRARPGEPGSAAGRVPVEPPRLAEPHPLPVTVAFTYEGLKRMRAVSAAVHELGALRGDGEPSEQWAELPEELVGLSNPAGAAAPGGHALRLHPREYFAGVRMVRPEGAEPAPAPPPGAAVLAVLPDPADGMAEAAPAGTDGGTDGADGGADGKAAAGSHWRRRIWAGRPRTLRPPGQLQARRANDVILWRGMKNLPATDEFMRRGGTELAPMSTTTDIDTAVRYARAGRGRESLLFRIRSNTFMNLGCDLTHFSAFPHEREALYPPLTYLQPTGKVHRIRYDGCKFTVIDVEPSFPS
jgi:hypothetical protein